MEYKKVASSLKALSLLPIGWDYGRGGPISDNVIDMGIYLFNNLNIGTSSSYNVTPHDSGGITIGLMIDWNLFLDIIIYDDCRFGLRIEKGVGPEYDILLEEEFSSLDEINKGIRIYSK